MVIDFSYLESFNCYLRVIFTANSGELHYPFHIWCFNTLLYTLKQKTKNKLMIEWSSTNNFSIIFENLIVNDTYRIQALFLTG